MDDRFTTVFLTENLRHELKRLLHPGSVLVFIVIALVLSGCGRNRYNETDIIARVDNLVLTHDDVDEALTEMALPPDDESLRSEYVNHWVDHQLLVYDAHRKHLDRDPEIIRRLERLHEELLIESLYNHVIEISEPTEQELVEYWQEHTGEFTRPTEEIRVIILTVPTRNLGWQVRNSMDRSISGNDLLGLYDNLQIDTTNWIRRSMLPDAVARGLRNLRTGDATLPIQIGDEWIVSRLIDRESAGSTRSFEEVVDEIRLCLIAEKRFHNRLEYLAGLRREARRNGLVSLSLSNDFEEIAAPDSMMLDTIPEEGL